jgi:ethanolamine utilization protein EutN
MFIGKVSGTVVASRKVDGLSGFKLLLVKKLDLARKETGDFTVAVDVVGAGVGETVLVVAGSSARQTERTDKKPVDAAIVGIIDSVTLDR